MVGKAEGTSHAFPFELFSYTLMVHVVLPNPSMKGNILMRTSIWRTSIARGVVSKRPRIPLFHVKLSFCTCSICGHVYYTDISRDKI
jgi:hypothetical protein